MGQVVSVLMNGSGDTEFGTERRNTWKRRIELVSLGDEIVLHSYSLPSPGNVVDRCR